MDAYRQQVLGKCASRVRLTFISSQMLRTAGERPARLARLQLGEAGKNSSMACGSSQRISRKPLVQSLPVERMPAPPPGQTGFREQNCCPAPVHLVGPQPPRMLSHLFRGNAILTEAVPFSKPGRLDPNPFAVLRRRNIVLTFLIRRTSVCCDEPNTHDAYEIPVPSRLPTKRHIVVRSHRIYHGSI